MKPATIEELLTRGVEQVLPGKDSLQEKLQQGPLRVYLGIDPTGSLLTLGHSVVLRKLQQFAELGHSVILLIGNGTVRIGDPTGRDSTRPELTDEEITANFETWKEQASKVLDFSKIEIRKNGDWLDALTYADIVKLLAKTTIQQLLERDMFQERIQKELPIHGHEIIYPLLQGYDSVVMDVDLEIGGSDQLFNMMMGRQLQKMYNNKEKWVLTTPIINGTDGRKMSKSYNNFVALTEPAPDMYGKLMRIADEQIIEYFTVLTDVALSEIEAMQASLSAGENPMELKKLLAKTITTMYHSEADAAAAEQHFETAVQNKELPENAPTVQLPHSPVSVLDILKACMPEESNSQLRRLVEQGAIEFLPSREKPTEMVETIPDDVYSGLEAIRVGKRRFFKVTRS